MSPKAAKPFAPLNIERVAVLLVDDNPFMRSLVRAILKAFGVRQVKEATDGIEALQTLSAGFLPDIMVVNWQMPRMDGIEFVRMVRKSEDNPARYVPVIMISGHSEQTRIFAARDAGVNEFLVKPISARLLYERIAKIVHGPRPFVRCNDYFGPDRRRRDDPKYAGPERRQQDPAKSSDGEHGMAGAPDERTPDAAEKTADKGDAIAPDDAARPTG